MRLTTTTGRIGATLVAVTFACVAIAQEASNPVRMGYTQLKPYSYTGENGEPMGYAIDLMERLAAPHGLDVEFVATANPAELLTLLENRSIDVTSLLAMTPERMDLGNFTDPIGSFQNSLFVLRNNSMTMPEDLTGRRIGVVAGSFSVTTAATVPFVNIVELEDHGRLILALMSGQIDAISTPKEPFQATLRSLNLDRAFTALEPPLREIPRGLLVREDLPALRAALDASIRDLSTRELMLLQERWFGKDHSFLDQPDSHWIVAGGLLALLSFLGALTSILMTRIGARRSFVEQSRNRLLVDALNAVDLAVVIYDSDLRAVHWNDSFCTAFPRLLPSLRRGAGLEEMINIAYATGTEKDALPQDEARQLASSIAQEVKSGKTVRRTVHSGDGRVYDRTVLPVGNDMFASVSKDVTRFEEQASEIRAKGGDLEVANAKLREFSSIVAHDLRAPLRQQRTLLDFIGDDIQEADIGLPDDTMQSIETAKRILGGLSDLVEDLLGYAAGGADASDHAAFDPQPRLTQVAALAAIPDGFTFEIEGTLPIVHAPPAAFDIVLRNILSNAIKHHDRCDGHITVRARQSGKLCNFEIQDDGPGIAHQYRERVFQPFQRLKSRDDVPGSGLGLAMVQRTVEAWGGTVSLQGGETGGSIFGFTVPCGQPDAGTVLTIDLAS
ncbi:MAG: transporter substrate-binding domain-containing protein [Pseudomonadota bacterium]